jgi:hypothetical protein
MTAVHSWVERCSGEGRLYHAAIDAREQLSRRRVDPELLARLYYAYNRIPDVDAFVESGLRMFPRLCCGLASSYLRGRLGEGVVCRGSYGGQRHSYLLVRGSVLDITADQFGGPEVYHGPLVSPWGSAWASHDDGGTWAPALGGEAAERADEADEARSTRERSLV